MTLWLSYCEWVFQFLRRSENENYHNIYLNYVEFMKVQDFMKCSETTVAHRHANRIITPFWSGRKVAQCFGRLSAKNDNNLSDEMKFNTDIAILKIKNSLIIFEFLKEIKGAFILEWIDNIPTTPHPNSIIYNINLHLNPTPSIVSGNQAKTKLKEQFVVFFST